MTVPVAHFSRRYRFSASHRLHTPSLTDQENRDTYGKCNNPHGHGHNYWLQVTVAGPVAADTGFVVNLPKLDALVQQQVLDRFDHMHLNQDAVFRGNFVPSTENLAVEVERILHPALAALATGGSLRLVSVRIEETGNNSFDLPAAGQHHAAGPRAFA